MKQGAHPMKERRIAGPPHAEPSRNVEESDDDPPDRVQPPAAAPLPRRPASTGKIVRFPAHRAGTLSPAVRTFRKQFFPGVSVKQWNDWRWQIGHRVRTLAQLESYLDLSDAEREALMDTDARLPLGITPYFLSLMTKDDPSQPLRRTMVPTVDELVRMPGEADDPLGEEHQSPVPGLVHRYPDRVLLLLSDFCAAFCRYCTRSRVVGHGAIHPSRSRLERAFEYIEATPAVRDVLLSGGDPLMLSDEKLSWVLSRLRQIRHVEIVRIGTKAPAVIPQRVTPQLVRMLRRYHPLWMSLHFTHPDECTPEAYRACGLLADAGIPLGSQTVLLRGINDDVDTMKRLVHHLMQMRVRPYYLYQCDPITGSGHFRTSIEKGLEIIRGLRGFTTGYAVPTYVVDAPGGGGKIPLMPESIVGREENATVLRNYENRLFRSPDPVPDPIESPLSI